MGSKPFGPQGEAQSCVFPQADFLCARVGLITGFKLSLCYLGQCGVLLVHQICRSMWASFWICFACSYRFGVSVSGGDAEASFIAILNWYCKSVLNPLPPTPSFSKS